MGRSGNDFFESGNKKKQERNTVLVQVMKISGVCLSLKFSTRQELVVSFKSGFLCLLYPLNRCY